MPLYNASLYASNRSVGLLELSYIVHVECICLLVVAMILGTVNVLDFLVQCHLVFIQKRKGFLIISATSLAQMAAIILDLPGSFYFEVASFAPKSFFYYVAYIDTPLNNSLMASWGYLLAFLSIDRYIAVAFPHKYPLLVRKSIQSPCILICFVCGFLSGGVASLGSYSLIESQNATPIYDITDNDPLMSLLWHKLLRHACIICQYFLPMAIMAVAGIAALRSLKNLETRLMITSKGSGYCKLRKRLRVSLRINLCLIVVFIILNTPAAISDLIYSIRMLTNPAFVIFNGIASFIQMLACTASIVVVTALSQQYRKTLRRFYAWLCGRESTREFLSVEGSRSSDQSRQKRFLKERRKRAQTTIQIFRIELEMAQKRRRSQSLG